MAKGFPSLARKKVGASPGSLVFVGEQRMDRVQVYLMDYDGENLVERPVDGIEDTFPFLDSGAVTWINFWGIHDVDMIRTLGKRIGLHDLLMEDIVNTTQRPKIEDHGDHLSIAVKMVTFHQEEHRVDIEHMTVVLGQNFVVSFQERKGDVFEPVRERIRKAKGRIRKMGADYLAYALLDTIVDNYFLTMEALGDEITELEEDLLEDPSPEVMKRIHSLKRELIGIRRAVVPMRELVSNLLRGEYDLVDQGTIIFIQDLYDHAVQITDSIETYRDMVSSLMDLHLSLISNRMNEVMKVLTIIATVFIPLTFIAGIYGMNFEYMPELKWHYAYFGVWTIILVVGAAMLVFFRRLKWL